MPCRLSTIWEEMKVPKIEKEKEFPSTQSWDDFLDFSRMSIPFKNVVTKRLFDNFWRFSGNYCGIWMVLTLAWGIILKWRLLASIAIIASCASFGKLMYVKAHIFDATANQRLDQIDVNLPPSSKLWFLLFTVSVMYAMSTLDDAVLALILALSVSSLHAIMRPVINEYYFIHQSQPKHSDGVEEDELIFTKENDNPNTNTSKRSLCKYHQS
ncbi:hypothetical protein HJC23_006122 [Cyclotella cryptica]|uniref:PRA1 family protein n=1 Tax=Cyclotella cryptica TaxID=29204 RepID=A0ABD3QK93_9STRA|eukprot:CCRYP_004600-RA/>CCRYP_004600-RA protein AED:0.00 eAED:0.00 QI:39/1/1/1/0.5/0.33/3/1095/211